MVALNDNFTEERDAGVRKQQSEKSVDRSIPASRRSPRSSGSSVSKIIDQRSRITDQKRRTSNDLFIDHYSLVIERSACANEIIYGGYPDNNRVSTDIGTGLNDPESELYYVRNRTYSPVLGRWIQRDPVGYSGGINLYEYGGGRTPVATDHNGTGFLPGWGYFGVSVQADSPETVATVVKFHVAPKYDNPTSHQCKCTEIAFVQYVSVKWHYFWGTSTEAWHIDTANPYPYPNGGKWTPGKGIAELVDNPGMNCGIGTYSFPCWWPWVNSLEMDFRDVAYCTKGKDKGDTVGTVTWGFKVSRTWEWLYIGGAHSLLALTVGIPGAANMQAGTTFVPTD